MRYVIKRDRLAALVQINEQAVFALDDIELVLGPAELPFDAVAKATKTGCFFAD